MRNTSLNYQLGCYVGEIIYRDFLPTLSTDMLKTRNVIDVTPKEALKYKELDDTWFQCVLGANKNKEKSKIVFEKMRILSNKLAIKHLPAELICYVPKVTPTNMRLFLKGISEALWDTDVSWYSVKPKNIKIIKSKGWATIVTLKLRTDE